jgi:XTP/dITP diphosphohydrolase
MKFDSVILIGSTNSNKLLELYREFNSLPLSFITPQELGTSYGAIPEVEESADTYLGNALLKAETFSKWSGLPVLADDSGLEVDCLGGAPGIYSARLASTEENRITELVKLMAQNGVSFSKALFRTVLVFYRPCGEFSHTEGVVEGTIGTIPRGQKGWGYEPLFVPNGEVHTIAELKDFGADPDSHRRRAARSMKEILALEI